MVIRKWSGFETLRFSSPFWLTFSVQPSGWLKTFAKRISVNTVPVTISSPVHGSEFVSQNIEVTHSVTDPDPSGSELICQGSESMTLIRIIRKCKKVIHIGARRPVFCLMFLNVCSSFIKFKFFNKKNSNFFVSSF